MKDDKSKPKKSNKKEQDNDNYFSTNQARYLPDDRERRDGPGGEDGDA